MNGDQERERAEQHARFGQRLIGGAGSIRMQPTEEQTDEPADEITVTGEPGLPTIPATAEERRAALLASIPSPSEALRLCPPARATT